MTGFLGQKLVIFEKKVEKRKKNPSRKTCRFSSRFLIFELREKVTSRAELKILQLELWLEPAQLGVITTMYVCSKNMIKHKFLDSCWVQQYSGFCLEGLTLMTADLSKKNIFFLSINDWFFFLSDSLQYFVFLYWQDTSHSAYVATSTESDGVKIDGLLPPNFL